MLFEIVPATEATPSKILRPGSLRCLEQIRLLRAVFASVAAHSDVTRPPVQVMPGHEQ